MAVASKCGFDVFGDRSVTNSASHIKEYIEGTIERLGFAPDLYYLHRIDPSKLCLASPFRHIPTRYPNRPLLQTLLWRSQFPPSTKSEGRTRLSISACLNAQLPRYERPTLVSFRRLVSRGDLLTYVIVAKIDALQAEYSAFETIHETDGLIDTARELGVAYVAYSPLGHGWLVDNFDYKSPDDFASDDFRRTCMFMLNRRYGTKCMAKLLIFSLAPKFQGENFYNNKAIVQEIKKLADRKGCSLTQIALAWVAAQGFIAIPGTTKPKRLEENWASRDIDLTEEEKAEMRRIVDSIKPHGNRYAPANQAMVGH